MDAFIDLPTFTDLSAGAGPVMAGFWQAFSPLMFWAGAIFIAAVIAIIIFNVISDAIKYANSHLHENNAMDIANTHEDQKKNSNYIKPGSIEDLSNKHYGFVGNQKEVMDRAKLKNK